MKKIAAMFCMFLILVGLFTGCGTDGEEYRTMVYRPVFEHLDGKNAMRFSNVGRNAEGYCYAYGYMAMTQNYDAGTVIVHTDAEGENPQEIKLDDLGVTTPTGLWVGERGVYVYGAFYNEEAGESRRTLLRYSPDGIREAEGYLTTIREKNSEDTSPVTSFQFAERENGTAMIWNNECFLTDDSFVRTSMFTIPGNADALFADGEDFWISYKEGNTRMLGHFSADGTLLESYPLPVAFERLPHEHLEPALLGYADGWVTARDSQGIFRWQVSADTENPVIHRVMNYVDSGIAADYIRDLRWIPGEGDGEFAVYSAKSLQSMDSVLQLYRADPSIDLSKMETLTLVCIQPEHSLTQAVVEFNRSRTDVRIEVVDYSVYNTDDAAVEGYERLMLDLTSRTVEPDLVFLPENDFYELSERMPEYFIDLYTLMDGEVTPESIYGCVKNTLEDENGALYAIAPEFSLSSFVGRRDAIGDEETWSLTEFLDFKDSLDDGEYLMEGISQENYSYELFGSLAYTPFIRDGQADFLHADSRRWLEFLRSLPAEEQTYMEHGENNVSALMAGEITADQVVVEKGGPNLYYSGQIKLDKPNNIYEPAKFLRTAYTFGTSSPAELNFIGYPVDERSASGVSVGFTWGVYSITSFCEMPDAAWDFIEYRLTADTYQEFVENSLTKKLDAEYRFKSYKPNYEEYLDKLEGFQIFFFLYAGYASGWDIQPEANGTYSGQEGMLYTMDRAAIDTLKQLLETAGIPLWYRNTVNSEVNAIIREEESRYLAGASTAEATADIIQSRVGIWLSEHE